MHDRIRPRSAYSRALSLLFIWMACVAVTLGACSGGDDTRSETATPTAQTPPSPTPRPVFLQPIDGADLVTGVEGGADFAIEVPEDWNGDLVLFLHGAQPYEPPAVSPPLSREHMIASGYAWGASAFRQAGFVPEIAVADTNALYERFVRDYGEPRNVYLYGASMGGAAAMIASEQEVAPYDGVLAVCASAGEQTWLALHADYLTIGANVVGVTAEEVPPSDIPALVDRIESSLTENAEQRNLFTSLMVGWTGGARPFAHEGLSDVKDRWPAVSALGAAGALDNIGRDYSAIGIEAGEAIVLRRTAEELTSAGDVTGQFRVPVLTLHDTGDAVVPLTDAIAILDRATAGAQGGRLVQRTVQSPTHCDFTDDELERAFDDMVAWVEDGMTPAGEDLSSFDPATLGAEFTTAER